MTSQAVRAGTSVDRLLFRFMLLSVTAAVVMSLVAAVIPPVAAIVGNLGSIAESELPRNADQRDLDDER